MKTDDPANYSTVTVLGTSSTDEMWNYGKEIWCNLKGDRVFLLANLAHLSGQTYT